MEFGILGHSGNISPPELEDFDVDIRDNEDVAVIEKNEVEPNRVPNWKVVERTSFGLFKEERDVVEELLNPPHAPSEALGCVIEEEPKEGRHVRGSN